MDKSAVPLSLPETPPRILPDESYLAVYDRREEGRRRNGTLSLLLSAYYWDPKKTVGALLFGMIAGFGIASVRMSDHGFKPDAIPPQVVIVRAAQPLRQTVPESQISSDHAIRSRPAVVQSPQPAPVGTSGEVARIKARNRRLEAAILVLRQRKVAPEKKPNPDSTGILGQ